VTLFTLAKRQSAAQASPCNDLVHPDLDKHWSPGDALPKHSVDKTCRLSLAQNLSYFETIQVDV